MWPFRLEWGGRSLEVEFDTKRCFGEFREFVRGEFGLCQCRLLGLKLQQRGKKRTKTQPGAGGGGHSRTIESRPLSDFRLKKPQRVRVVGTSVDKAESVQITENTLQAQKIKRSGGEGSEGLEFLYGNWQQRRLRELCDSIIVSERKRPSRLRKKMMMTIINGCFVSSEEFDASIIFSREAHQIDPPSLGDKLRACVASGRVSVVEDCLNHHRRDNIPDYLLDDATKLACRVGSIDMLDVLDSYRGLQNDRKHGEELLKWCIGYLHLPIIQTLHEERKIDIGRHSTLWLDFSAQATFFPLLREVIYYLIMAGGDPGLAIVAASAASLECNSLQRIIETVEMSACAKQISKKSVLYGCRLGLRISIAMWNLKNTRLLSEYLIRSCEGSEKNVWGIESEADEKNILSEDTQTAHHFSDWKNQLIGDGSNIDYRWGLKKALLQRENIVSIVGFAAECVVEGQLSVR
mmetsp:Transcript_6570/g.12063  ORF Transcript_6570/g.12063 Transcript_6570/m.12063 type:complete len:463 (-) Transcript_6570:528-1916(-)